MVDCLADEVWWTVAITFFISHWWWRTILVITFYWRYVLPTVVFRYNSFLIQISCRICLLDFFFSHLFLHKVGRVSSFSLSRWMFHTFNGGIILSINPPHLIRRSQFICFECLCSALHISDISIYEDSHQNFNSSAIIDKSLLSRLTIFSS